MSLEPRSILIAYACGCFIGAVFAQAIGHYVPLGQYLWGVGALIGGFVAWALAEPKHFRAVVSHSYKKTINWEPNPLYWRAVGVAFVASFVVAASIITSILIFFWTTDHFRDEEVHRLVYGTNPAKVFFWAYGVACTGGALFVTFLSATTNLQSFGVKKDDEAYVKHLLERTGRFWEIARIYNPVGAVYYGIYYTLVGLSYITSILIGVKNFFVEIGQLLWAFISMVFIRLHSKVRTTCFVITTLVVAAGYVSFGTLTAILVSTLLGPIIGKLEYEFVAIRWLKTIEVKNR